MPDQNDTSVVDDLLEQIRYMLLREHSLSKVADIVNAFTELYPHKAEYVVNRLPAVILNEYIIDRLSVTDEARFQYFEETQWAKDIVKYACDSTALPILVKNLILKINKSGITVID